MRTQKTNTANIEKKRVTHFLLGIIVALTIIVVALEYNSNNNIEDAKNKDIDELEDALKIIPAIDNKTNYAKVIQKKTKIVSEKIEEVKQEVVKQPTINETVVEETLPDEKENVENTTQTAAMPVVVDKNYNQQNFRVIEQLPEFPGGMTEFLKWITRNLKYPARSKQQKIEGVVQVRFTITTAGKVTNTQILKSVSPDIDMAVMRIINDMPDWKPGIRNGKICATVIKVPIIFKL